MVWRVEIKRHVCDRSRAILITSHYKHIINRILPPATKLGQGYFFTGVCDSVHRGGSASVQAGMPPHNTPPPPHPWAESSPLEQDPPDQPLPRDQAPPPSAEHAGRYGQRAGGMHPTGMQSCFTENFRQICMFCDNK